MYLSDVELHERFRDKRPGLELIAIEAAAIPVTVLSISILAQQRKDLDLLDEFLLRSIAAGMETVADIASNLGISDDLLGTAVVSQVALHNVTYQPSKQQLKLTPQGKEVASELSMTVPIEREVQIAFDRSVWHAADYIFQDLVRKHDAVEAGMVLLPAAKSATIGVGDVRAKDVESLVQSDRSANRFQVLQVLRARRSRLAYLPVKLLVFADRATAELEIMVIVDGDHSPLHDSQLAAAGGATRLRLRAAVGETGAIQTAAPLASDASSTPTLADVVADAEPEEVVVRQLGVYEHAIELQRALAGATKRLLIISPWIRRAVVDTQFLADLERRLRAGVVVAIGHGYGKDDSGSDQDAIRKLSNLQNRFKTTFVFARLPNTHAKILLHDDTYVTTSFNWLSFRGDPDRTYRMEEGTLIENRQYANEAFERYMSDLIK